MTTTTLDRSAIVLDYRPVEPPDDMTCSVCHDVDIKRQDIWQSFGLALRDQARLCYDCAEQHIPEAFRTLIGALNDVDMALFEAESDGMRRGLLGHVIHAVGYLGDTWELTSEGPQ